MYNDINTSIRSKNNLYNPNFRGENKISSPRINRPINNQITHTQSKTKETLLTIGALALASFGAIFAAKNKTIKNGKALQAIEQKFLTLKQDIPNVQKTFKEVFLRDDITEKQTIEMLDRYKEIQKLTITGTKEEYIKALYNEAKNNYGFKDLPFEIEIVNKPIRGNEKITAITNPFGDICIKSTLSHNEIADSIHHELRHVKQRYYSYNLHPEEYVKHNQPNNMVLSADIFECAFGGKPDIKKIPSSNMEFAEMSSKGMLSYCSVQNNENAYFNQWIEKDAYLAGQKIAKLLQV